MGIDKRVEHGFVKLSKRSTTSKNNSMSLNTSAEESCEWINIVLEKWWRTCANAFFAPLFMKLEEKMNESKPSYLVF